MVPTRRTYGSSAKKVGILRAQYLPEEEDDDKRGKGRSKGVGISGSKQRCPKERRMRMHDPYEAGRRALEWELEG